MMEAMLNSFLPELVSGRGTVRRTVEGQTRRSLLNDMNEDAIEIRQDLARRYAKGKDPRPCQPKITGGIPLRRFSSRVRFTIDLDRQSCVAAEEIEDVWTGRVLPTKLQRFRTLAQFPPQQTFGQAQRFAQATRFADCPMLRFGRDVLEQRLTPPPCFAWSPSPRQARGGMR